MAPISYAELRARRPVVEAEISLCLKDLAKMVRAQGPTRLWTTPTYQRDRVWTEQQGARFVGSLAEGVPVPPIFIQRWPVGTGRPDELVDGLQRVSALLAFLDNAIPLEASDGRQQRLGDFNAEDQQRLRSHAGLRLAGVYVACPTEAAVLDLYLRLNAGGTPHTAQELDRVRELRAGTPADSPPQGAAMTHNGPSPAQAAR